MEQELTFDLLSDDDFFLSALFDENPDGSIPISDSKYGEELQLQEAITASFIASQMLKNLLSTSPQETPPSSSSSSTPSDPELDQQSSTHSEPELDQLSSTPSEPELDQQTDLETGEPSQILCEICDEMKESEEMFRNGTCSHLFCTDCISKYVAAKIEDNINTVFCPGLNCKAVIELDTCKEIIPENVLVRWGKALSESTILPSQKFYCPYKDCSALLENDNGGEVRIGKSECPVCRRLFCAECYVSWHSGVECEEFQRLNEDERGKNDLMVMVLAKEAKWRRCPHCKSLVERTQGCLHIVCRCKFEFCYGCGRDWTGHGSNCQQ